MAPLRRIALVTSLLGGGGAERIAVTMAAWWARQGHRVCIFVLREDGAVPEYDVPPLIEVVRLRLLREDNPVWSFRHPRALYRLRRAILGFAPNLVVSFLDKLNVAVLLALRRAHVPVVATEHLAPWCNPLGPVWEWLRRWTYPSAMLVACPTDRITSWFTERIPGKYATLPSPAALKKCTADRPERARNILGAGRLVPQKGFDRLIEIAAQVLPGHPDWQLLIAGEGPERPKLEYLIESLDLQGRVRLLGAVSNIFSEMERSSVFALSSRHEAYPMVLCEALAAGCAVVAFDCPTGPKEILGAPPAGYLIPDGQLNAFSTALRCLIENSDLRLNFSAMAQRKAESLDTETIMPLWDKQLAAIGLCP
jgi:GalNAc-alpha-(1->4)-GalNAc-alpha-(1->3)-diNAcBac-PP-undecaprenol alpha-1,4-N-acetyl-D-galactosaminyltransferase